MASREFRVTFYYRRSGPNEAVTKPVLDFLGDLRASHPTLEKLAVAGLNKLRFSEFHRGPLVELVDEKDRVFELRVGHSDIARLFFFFHARQEIIVTNGYVKKAQKLDTSELNRARSCKRDWEERFPI